MFFQKWFDDQDFIHCCVQFFSIFEKFWKYGKDLFACFIDLEKVYYDCLSIFGGFQRRMAVMVIGLVAQQKKRLEKRSRDTHRGTS